MSQASFSLHPALADMRDFFSEAAARPERTVLVMAATGEAHSAGAVAEGALQLAQWLGRQGLQTGERFAIVLENRIEIVQLVLAARHAGLYATVISTHLTPEETAYIVQDSSARLVLGSDRTWAQLDRVRSTLDLPCWNLDTQGQPDALHDALQAMQGEDIDFSARPMGRDLLYSSGTTGQPKGVLQPLYPAELRDQMLPEALRTAALMGMGPDTVYLSPAPLYHAAPLRYTLRVLDLGGQVVIMDGFDPEQALALIERYRVTHSQWVPTMFGRMLQLPQETRQRHDLSSHRVAIHAAAPCPAPLKQAMLDWWGDILVEYYAGSEGCGVTTINSQEWRQRPGSVGRATTGELRILDEDGQLLPPGEVGMVYFEGGPSFSYLGDEEKTRQAINERGWATYGDLGHVDEDGYLFLSDRRADLILSGGVNLYPQEIENALIGHPDVREVAVVGVPDPDLGELAAAVIVLQARAEPDIATAHAIVEHAQLSRIKRPRRVVFVESLPRLATGKLLRRELKQQLREQPDSGFDLRAPAS